MEIGTKLKNARNKSGMTQEAVAEAVGVSRQTVSNWENEKSYPDIISVIKMSDLFSVSLDHLLKEEADVKQTYLEYLDESTNTVKSHEKLGKLILVISTLAVWTLALTFFWLFMNETDAGAFSLIFIWIILPVTIFTVSLIIGKRKYFGKAGFAAVPIFGIAYMLSEYATFSTANMIRFSHISPPEFAMIPAGMIISLLGIMTGIAADRIMRRKNK